MTSPTPPTKQDFSKSNAKTAAVVLIAVIITAIILVFAIPRIQQQIAPAPSANFAFTSKNSWNAWEGGFLGIGANNVIYVQGTLKNVGNAAGGCSVNAYVDDDSGYWTDSESVYLGVGEEKTIKFKFDQVSHSSGNYQWSIYVG